MRGGDRCTGRRNPSLPHLISITLLVGCSSAPAPIGAVHRPAPPPVEAPVAAPPSAPPPPPSVALVIAVMPDGGAELLCSFAREDGCGIREIRLDGEERRRSELAPGQCEQWVPREGGGGVLVTRRGASARVAS